MAKTPEQDRVRLISPPNLVTVQMAQPWHVVTPYVYRYEDNRWIDAFLETGALRVSTFSKFAKYPDEIRGDTKEGFGFCYGETANNQSVMTVQREGVNALVLCCSHKLDHSLKHGFKRNSAFQIMNTMGFSMEVARQLRGFRHGLEGSCIYRADSIINRKIDFDFDEYKLPDGNVDMQMLFDASKALGGPELLLLKRKIYEAQQEYRLIWEVDTLEGGFIDVMVPNAKQYCRRVDNKEWDDSPGVAEPSVIA